MRFLSRLAALALLSGAPCFSPRLQWRGPSACLPSDELGEGLVEMLRRYAAPNDSVDAAFADTLRIPRTGSAPVVAVRERATCERAARAYGLAVGAGFVG